MINELKRPDDFDTEVARFHASRESAFSRLVEELACAISAPDRADFTRMLNHARTVLDLTDLDLSKLFKVSRPTINRWGRGVTAPHPLVRGAVYEELLDETKRRIRGFKVAR